MSQLNALGEGGLNDLLSRRLNIPGAAAAPTVEPALFAGLTLENDRPEWSYLKGEWNCMGNTSAAANAGFRSSAVLYNPVRSGLIVTVQTIYAVVASGTVHLRMQYWTPTALPPGVSVSGVRVMDGRAKAAAGDFQRSGCQLYSDNATAVSGNSLVWVHEGTSMTLDLRPLAIVLDPGSSIYVSPATDNVALTRAAFIWRERPAMPRELV